MIKKTPAANLDSRMGATFPPAQTFCNRPFVCADAAADEGKSEQIKGRCRPL
jgi:hypothetical protein